MTGTDNRAHVDFDDYAADYDEALSQGLSISGENKDFFAEARVARVRDCLRAIDFEPRQILDFGCGTGSSVQYLRTLTEAPSITGVDLSRAALARARALHARPDTRFFLSSDYVPSEEIDLAFCNGVFHHIPVAKRMAAIAYVKQSLRQGGLFAFWENNWWSPAARYVMSRIPFDRDAVMLSAREARGLLTASGFSILRTEFNFVFPRSLQWLRRLEGACSPFPLGAQFLVLAKKIRS
jgi:SAM-dependent methyltransferase